MRAIYKKELRGFFFSMIGWLFLAVNLFFAGWHFRAQGMTNGYPYISYVISSIMFIFLCSIPILTMRIFADETKQRTDQLLYTSPVPIWKIVIGKYLALITLIFGITIVIGLYQFILGIYGKVPYGENLLALLGFFLFAITCEAIGLFLSSITDSQIIAAVLTFFTLMVTAMISSINNLISSTGNIFTKILSIVDMTGYLQNFLYGKLYIPAFFYYLSVIAICLYLTIFFIQKKRWSVASHGIAKVVSSASGMVVTLIVIVAINVLVSMLPEKMILKDLTYNGLYSLTSESRDFLRTIDEPITIYVLAESSDQDSTIANTLENMANFNKNITVTNVSPTQNPSFYSSYTDTNPTYNSLIVTCGEKSKVIDYFLCYQMTYEYDFDFASGSTVVTDYTVTGYDGEGRIISAISYVSNPENQKVYCITGHDELDLEDNLKAELDKANIDYESINLLTYDRIPEDADCIFVLGPLVDFTNDEIEKVNFYLTSGGNAVFLVAYTDAMELTNYYSLLQPYGINVEPGLVMEQGSSYYNTQQYLLLPDILNSDITKGVFSTFRNKYVYLPFAKGFTLTQMASDVTSTTFLQTTENAYLLTDIAGEDDTTPPTSCYVLGVFSTKIYPEFESSILAISSDYFLYQDVDEVVNGNNYIVFMNAVNKILGNEDTSSIPAKEYSYDTIVMDEAARAVFSFVVLVIIPVALVFVGLIFIRRRKHNLDD